MKRYALLISILGLLALTSVSWSVSQTPDYAVFLQKEGELKSLYIAEIGNSAPHLIVSDKGLSVFLQEQQLLYFHDRQLYRYDPLTQESRLLTKFKEPEIKLQVLPGTPGQALVSARTDGYNYEINWYVLELNDGSLRRVSPPGNASGGGEKSLKGLSPDELSQVVLTHAKRGFSLAVQRKLKGRFSQIWSLPQEMTVIPELPVWAPNSRLLAFYAKPVNNQAIYYSLYIFNLDTLKLIKVQEQVYDSVFTATAGFRPEWSADSQTLIFQYQPYGSPTQSLIMSYEVKNAKQQILVKGPGMNEYPQLSPSNQNLIFLSDRDGIRHQVYIMNLKDQKPERLLVSGETEWCDWYQP